MENFKNELVEEIYRGAGWVSMDLLETYFEDDDYSLFEQVAIMKELQQNGMLYDDRLADGFNVEERPAENYLYTEVKFV